VFLVLATAERALAHASSTAATEAQQRARKYNNNSNSKVSRNKLLLYLLTA
jgi:hypothetical protein